MGNMTDKELDKLLAEAKQPPLPKGFADRLQSRLDAEASSNVITFPKARIAPAKNPRWWLGAVPLAASLLLGVYLGAAAGVPDSLSGIETAFASNTETVSDIGIEEVEDFMNGDFT